jgi:hypothetical protein
MTNFDIVKRLIGPILPVGDSNIDNERFENLKLTCKLTNDLLFEIEEKSCASPNSKEYSVRRNSDYGIKFLTDIGFKQNRIQAYFNHVFVHDISDENFEELKSVISEFLTKKLIAGITKDLK